MSRARIIAVFAAICLVLAACSSDGPVTSQGTASSASSSKAKGKNNKSNNNTKSDGGGDEEGGSATSCPSPAPAPTGTSATAKSLSDNVSVAEYPLPDRPANLWSQWGQGIVRNNAFFSAVGDECGVDGNAYLYQFDPASSTVKMIGDVLSVVPHQNGTFGYGKIHAQMVSAADGMIYATTYWGSRRGIEYGNGYDGDVLLRIDPSTGSITNLGVVVPEHGVPTLAGSKDGKLLFGEAVEPVADPEEGLFFVYDIAAGKVIFQRDNPSGAPGYRNILVDGSGKAWWSVGDGEAATYDPATNTVGDSNVKIPNGFLRAATHPAPDGTVYGVTEGGKGEPDVFFRVSSDGQLTQIGEARGYTTSIALSPDGHTLFYVPDAHGKAFEQGAPVIAFDTSTGDEREVVKLNDLIQPQLNLLVGGSYDVVLDDSGSTLFIGLNVGDPSTDSGFGKVVLAIVKL